jgi:VanZ family protein
MVKEMHKSTKKVLLKYVAIILWMIVIFIFSSQVAKVSEYQSGLVMNLVNTHGIHWTMFETRKFAHSFLYLILGILIYNVVKEYNLGTKRAILLSILLSLSYASFDEAHQLLVSGRSGQVSDVLIDTIASAVGIGAYNLAQKHIIKRNRSKCLKKS